ncbi:MAG: hypothetical protein II776_00860, partial [Clostridia bacterium]|nr:hypothetical protein [Clostridia bacterium]
EAELTFTMPRNDVTLRVTFNVVTYRFRLIVGTGGTASVDGRTVNERGEYECVMGDEIEILAEARDNYLFSGWTATNGASFSDPDSPSTTLICPASDFVLRAQFASSIKDLTVTSTEGGSVSPQEGTFRFGVDNVLELLAIPDEGYVFSAWECSSPDGKFSDPKRPSSSFTMPDADCTITAVFTKGGYRLSVVASVGGRVKDGSAGNYEMGEQIPLTAMPEEGYEFSRWQSSVEGAVWDEKAPETVITMPGEDVKITAVFVLKGGGAVPVSDGDDVAPPPRSFPWIPLIVVFVLSAIAILLIVIRERFNLSYRYLIRKWFRKLTGRDEDE